MQHSIRHLFLMLALAAGFAAPAQAEPAKAQDNAKSVKAKAVHANGVKQQEADDEAMSRLDDDPLSGYNRAMYEFNYVVDGLVLKPAAQLYRGVVPEKGREMVNDALANLYSPITFGNSVLQGDAHNSFATFFRFLINSTVGIGGLFDVASEAGLKNRTTDFGQTLAIYGAEPGAYVVLPIIGPSNVRDTIGRVADLFMQPWTYANDMGLSAAIYGATAVNARSENMKLLDDIYTSSVDPYSTFKSGYTQKRASDVKRAKIERQKTLEKTGFQ